MKLENSIQHVEDDSLESSDAHGTDLYTENPQINPKIKIRFAQEADRESVRNLAKWQHEQTVFGDIEFCDKKFDAIFGRWKSSERFECGIVAQLGGKILGGLYASAGEYRIGKGEILTTVHAIAVDGRSASPGVRAKVFLMLVRGVKQWAQTRGVGRVLVNVTTGREIEEVDRLLKVAGAESLGGSYVV